MAFFKFRLPGNPPAVAAETHVAAPGESVETIRRRARHRLMGAVVLVFIGVVAFPLLFDSQPRPVAVDTPILIPDRQATAPLASGVPLPAVQSPAKPLLPAASSPLPAQASLEPGKEEVVTASAARPDLQPALPTASPAPAASGQNSMDPAAAPKPPEATANAKPEPRDKPAPKVVDDGQKAKALLEGKSTAPDPSERVVIQVGAFTDPDKVREVRRKLEQAGLKTYTQTVEGKDGKRTTRIRLGPFDSRVEADKAAARVRKLDLPANLIAL